MGCRWLLVAIVSLGWLAPARGESRLAFEASARMDERPVSGPALRFGYTGPQVTITRARIGLRVESRRTLAQVTFVLAATHTESRDVPMTFQVPHGARVTSLAITSGRQRRLVATMLPRDEARSRYQAIVEQRVDPALLEWTRTADDHDELALRVFPLAADLPATVELGMELPRGATLAIDPGEQRIAAVEVTVERGGHRSRETWRDLGSPRTLTLGGGAAVELPAARGAQVTPTMSLLAGTARTHLVISCSFGAAVHERSSVGPRDIRTLVRRQHARLRRCYMQAAQGNPTLAGSVMLQFTIATDGTVTSGEMAGDLENAQVASCLADEVASWRFHASDETVRVNYPLTFRLHR